MKIKDLLDFNPEADIKVIMPDYLPFEGKITYGWSNDGGESCDNSKETATEVCILLGHINETTINL